MEKNTTRRQFLKTGATIAAGAPFIMNSAWASSGRVAPSDRITIGIIGHGRMGRGLTNNLLGFADTQVVAVCDVAQVRLEQGEQAVNEYYAEETSNGSFDGCDTYGDFRELTARTDIDAVVIATPDHWHAIPALHAARSGKHIYCEKPMVHTIREGRAVADAVEQAGVTFQTGSQQRTTGPFRRACELVRNGRIGEVHTIRVGVGAAAVPCDLPGEPLPDGIDWDMWLGPAPYRRYSSVLCPPDIHDHYPDWRDYEEYAGGLLSDWGAHHFDIVQWALDMDDSGPVEVHPPDRGLNGGLMFRYDNGVMVHHANERNAVTFHGTEGEISVARGFIESTPSAILDEPIGADEIRLQDPGVDNHQRNWLDCIESGQRPMADAEVGHRSNTVCQLANIGYALGRSLHWDPVEEQFEDDEEANSRVDKVRRHPWTLEA